MHVREATTDDVPPIRRVADAAWTTAYDDILTRETATEAVDEWYDEQRLHAAIDRTTDLVLVAVTDDTVAGFAHAVVDTDVETGHLLRVYVHPDRRRHGTGERLVTATAERVAERGVNALHATVLAANDPGRAFYESLGFRATDDAETTIAGDTYPEIRYVLDGDTFDELTTDP